MNFLRAHGEMLQSFNKKLKAHFIQDSSKRSSVCVLIDAKTKPNDISNAAQNGRSASSESALMHDRKKGLSKKKCNTSDTTVFFRLVIKLNTTLLHFPLRFSRSVCYA